MTDVKQFAEFYFAVDWEGGLEGIVRHGFRTSGDEELNKILAELEWALNAADRRIEQIMNEHGDEVMEIQDNDPLS